MRVIVYILVLFISNILYSQVSVKVGVYVKELNINNADGTYYMDFYWWCKVPNSIHYKNIEEYAELEFINAKSEIENKITEIEKFKDFYYVTGYCKGEFNFIPDFRKYPIDKQDVSLIIESVNLPNHLVKLVPDITSYDNLQYQGFNNDIIIPNFKVLGSKFNQTAKTYTTSFGDPNFKTLSHYSRLTYTISIKRNSTPYLLKILIPLLLLSFVAYLVFFIPADKLDVAVGCTVTSLLAAIAVQLTTVSDIPNVGYITNSDMIFYLFYFLFALALIQTVITYNLEKNKKLKLSNRLELLGRVVYPIILVVGLLIIIF